MSNYTSAMLPKVSYELLDRMRNDIRIADLDKYKRKLSDENPYLLDTLINNCGSKIRENSILDSSIFLYALLDEASNKLRVNDFLSSEDFTSSGLPIFKKDLDEILFGKDGKELFFDDNFRKLLLRENEVLAHYVLNSISISYNHKTQSYGSGLVGASTCYFLLHQQGLRILGGFSGRA